MHQASDGSFRDFDKEKFLKVLDIVGARRSNAFIPIFGAKQPVHVAMSDNGAQEIRHSDHVDEWEIKSRTENVQWFQVEPEKWRVALQFIGLQSYESRSWLKVTPGFPEVCRADWHSQLLGFGKSAPLFSGSDGQLWGVYVTVGHASRTYVSRNASQLLRAIANEANERNKRYGYKIEFFLVNEKVFRFMWDIFQSPAILRPEPQPVAI